MSHNAKVNSDLFVTEGTRVMKKSSRSSILRMHDCLTKPVHDTVVWTFLSHLRIVVRITICPPFHSLYRIFFFCSNCDLTSTSLMHIWTASVGIFCMQPTGAFSLKLNPHCMAYESSFIFPPVNAFVTRGESANFPNTLFCCKGLCYSGHTRLYFNCVMVQVKRTGNCDVTNQISIVCGYQIRESTFFTVLSRDETERTCPTVLVPFNLEFPEDLADPAPFLLLVSFHFLHVSY